ncbi:unnamed protein product [Ixodes persulcatus]
MRVLFFARPANYRHLHPKQKHHVRGTSTERQQPRSTAHLIVELPDRQNHDRNVRQASFPTVTKRSIRRSPNRFFQRRRATQQIGGSLASLARHSPHPSITKSRPRALRHFFPASLRTRSRPPVENQVKQHISQRQPRERRLSALLRGGSCRHKAHHSFRAGESVTSGGGRQSALAHSEAGGCLRESWARRYALALPRVATAAAGERVTTRAIFRRASREFATCRRGCLSLAKRGIAAPN